MKLIAFSFVLGEGDFIFFSSKHCDKFWALCPSEFSLELPPSACETADLYSQWLLLDRECCLQDANSRSRFNVGKDFLNYSYFQEPHGYIMLFLVHRKWTPGWPKGPLNGSLVSVKHWWKVNSFSGEFLFSYYRMCLLIPVLKEGVFLWCVFKCSKLPLCLNAEKETSLAVAALFCSYSCAPLEHPAWSGGLPECANMHRDCMAAERAFNSSLFQLL